MSFEIVSKFEKKIAEFFGSKYAVAVDCCTHAIELCLIYNKIKSITVPHRTYISIPLLCNKLNLEWEWKIEEWENYYQLGDSNIYDAAVSWKRNSYLPGAFMCLSFQFRKHLSLGRGGMILTDSKLAKEQLTKMAYDGRERNDVSWSLQNINIIGYHYYMTPEIAQKGIEKLPEAIKKSPKKWVHKDWPDLRRMDIFKKVNEL
jgi:dTDP-4-amino-4,6-dideoxygalactose transaminase